MRWKLHCLWSLCAALSLSEALAATIDLIETVSYQLTFQTQSGGVRLYDGGHFEDGKYRAFDNSSAGGSFYGAISLGFWHHGNKPLDFSGTTLDIAGLLSSPSGPIEEAYGIYPDPFYENLSGFIMFGADNTITDWYVHEWHHWGEDQKHWSDPRIVDLSWDSFRYLEDPSLYIGMPVYGDYFSGGDDHAYLTNPGRWLTSIQRLCYIAEDGSQAPCPDPIPPLNGCGPSGGVRSKCDPLALVPLPPSLLLLVSGLAGLGVLRGRRTRLAG